MHLSHLSLINFRNFLQLELDVPPGIVVLFGRNAQGKTSLLEAIYLLAIAKSFRAESEHEVVNWSARQENGEVLVAGTIENQAEKLKVYVGYQCVPRTESQSGGRWDDDRRVGVRKQIRVSRVKRTAAELVGLVNAVLFSADDIELVHGPPSLRRRYLDILMSQGNPLYLKTLQRYHRVLYQRNRLLRLLQDRRAEEDELAFWNDELVKEGSWIVDRRLEAMNSLSNLCRERHNELTGDTEDLSVQYVPSIPEQGVSDTQEDTANRFMAALKSVRSKEMAMGSTTVGPHRDDIKLLANGVDMGTYASRGQARTVALTLRLAEAAYLASIRAEGPIVLLDDVLSEMDSFRRAHVLDKALEYQQVIITTTDVDFIRGGPLSDASYYEVEDGQVSLVSSPAFSAAE